MNALNLDTDFYGELIELIESSEILSINLENKFSNEGFDNLIRNLHSIKGNVSMLGFSLFEKKVHFLEDIVTNERNNFKSISQPLLQSLDFIQEYANTGNEKYLNWIDHQLFMAKKPLSQEKNQSQTIRPHKIKGFRDLNIYIIDDEQEILEQLKFILERKSTNVTTFESSKTLKEALYNNPLPDLIIVDNRLKQEHGTDILQGLNAIIPDLPKVLMTGYVSNSVLEQSVKYGAVGVLKKPIYELELERSLLRAMKLKLKKSYINKSKSLLESLINKKEMHEFKKEISELIHLSQSFLLK